MNIERQLKVMQVTLMVMVIAMTIGFFYAVHLHNQLKRELSAEVDQQIKDFQAEFIAEAAAPILSFRKTMGAGSKEIQVHSIHELIEGYFDVFESLLDPIDMGKETNPKP